MVRSLLYPNRAERRTYRDSRQDLSPALLREAQDQTERSRSSNFNMKGAMSTSVKTAIHSVNKLEVFLGAS